MRHRKLVLSGTFLAFLASQMAFGKVQHQFFAASDRLEVLVDLELPEGSTFSRTDAEVRKLEAYLKQEKLVSDYVSYIGGSSPRFFLSLAPESPRRNYAQLIISTRNLEDSNQLAKRLDTLVHAEFSHLRARVSRLENGPPVGYPVQFRVLGPDPQEVKHIGASVRDIMRTHPHTKDVNLEWGEGVPRTRLVLDNARALALGVSEMQITRSLGSLLDGAQVAQVREGRELIPIVARGELQDRINAGVLPSLHVSSDSGKSLPLSQLAELGFDQEDGIIWHRNRDVCLRVRADVQGAQGPKVTADLEQQLRSFSARLPRGYRIETAGETEESAKGEHAIMAVMPLMAAVMITILMWQLRSFSRLAVVLLTAPLGLIGVTCALLLFRAPFGFVAQLGVIALAGMIMRASVILVDQIELDIRSGIVLWDAILNATVRRTRPLLLTASAAILAMIPLSRSTFWGPMAISIMGGLLVATLLTLFFVPALYAAWFGASEPGSEPTPTTGPGRASGSGEGELAPSPEPE